MNTNLGQKVENKEQFHHHKVPQLQHRKVLHLNWALANKAKLWRVQKSQHN